MTVCVCVCVCVCACVRVFGCAGARVRALSIPTLPPSLPPSLPSAYRPSSLVARPRTEVERRPRMHRLRPLQPHPRVPGPHPERLPHEPGPTLRRPRPRRPARDAFRPSPRHGRSPLRPHHGPRRCLRWPRRLGLLLHGRHGGCRIGCHGGRRRGRHGGRHGSCHGGRRRGRRSAGGQGNRVGAACAPGSLRVCMCRGGCGGGGGGRWCGR
jgi:hypothetical protein